MSQAELFTGEEQQLSGRELARIVRSCAYVHRDTDFGNPATASYLLALADWLVDQKHLPFKVKTRRVKKSNKMSDVDEEMLREMDSEAVRRFIHDGKRPKSDRVRLAGLRLSIPHSRLQRLRHEEIRETIEAALRHEESLSLIAEEARRGGEQRSS